MAFHPSVFDQEAERVSKSLFDRRYIVLTVRRVLIAWTPLDFCRTTFAASSINFGTSASIHHAWIVSWETPHTWSTTS